MSTITIPSPVPSPANDAESIRKALQGWRADKEALVRILAQRTAAQRSGIRRAYAFLFREPLLNSFRQRLSRQYCPVSLDFWKAIILWTMDPAERDANLVHGALKRMDGDFVSVLVEVACASTPDHLVAVRRAYCSLFACSVEEDLASSSAFEQPLKKMLVSLLSSYRYGGVRVNQEVAKLEATQLSEAIRKKEPHRDEVIRIVSTRSKAQLGATLQRYRDDHHGTDFVQDIDSHCSSQFAKTLKIAVWCLTSPEKHFAEVIRESIAGLGTYEDMLTRAIVSRAEIDMRQIKAEYTVRFKTTVTRDVVDDTSFGYRDLLLALVGSEEEGAENMRRCIPC
ncbi:annexin D3-like [Lolium perenne]|uniref:annexin D3-like n=1 Tax=Lolium perenne TaxID=4522 RepID=UPI0021F63F23|nr:annexin D3-like [Lolium perenne]